MIFVLITRIFAQNGQLAHRAYWNDNTCKGEITMAISVFIPQAPCQSSTPINQICEIKSTGLKKSSEGTGCETITKYTDNPWIPSNSVGKLVPNANYMAITQYNGPTCDGTGKTTFEQNVFAADGSCFAIETENSFFKATCTENSGSLTVCKDSACTDCDSLLNAGTFQSKSISFSSNTCQTVSGQAMKMTCLSPSQASAIQSGGAIVTGTNSTPGATGTSKTSSGKEITSSFMIVLFTILGFFS
jgi:hypothetical protein